MPPLDDAALRTLFLDARTHIAFRPEPVDDALLVKLYETLRMAPTANNSQPGRVVFVKSPEAKARLLPAVSPGNVAKVTSAPVTAIVAWDTAFYEKMNVLVPHQPDAGVKLGAAPAERREKVGVQSATLQASSLILAARALGLDCGPMGGFDAAKVDEAFFPDGAWRSLLLVNLGHGDPEKLRPRAPRLSFAEACRIV